MNIGTAKPDADTLRIAPHRLIDILDPAESYSAARFREDALREMAEITAAGHVPLLTGGTMLYFRALQQGLAKLPEADPGTRERLASLAAEIGWAAMHRRLAEVDPASAARIHPNDPQRIQRALEVYELSGRSLSQHFEQAGRPELPYRLIKLAVAPPERAELHRRIEQRFMQMMEQGFLAEVEALYARDDLGPDRPSIRAVGYRQLWEYLDGGCDYDSMLEKALAATRQLAKRQMTWLRSEQNVDWFDTNSDKLLDRALKTVQHDLIH
jgi:tRNA dimethylallyltransferase